MKRWNVDHSIFIIKVKKFSDLIEQTAQGFPALDRTLDMGLLNHGSQPFHRLFGSLSFGRNTRLKGRVFAQSIGAVNRRNGPTRNGPPGFGVDLFRVEHRLAQLASRGRFRGLAQPIAYAADHASFLTRAAGGEGRFHIGLRGGVIP